MPAARLVRNAGWNLAGVAVPLAAALVCIPVLIRTVGDARFGFLSIAWVLVGYFGLFDLGMGRAITYGVARRMADDHHAGTVELVWTGLGILAVVGLVTGVAAAALSRFLVVRVLNVPAELHQESVRALMVLALSLPFVLVSAGLRGALEARQAFRTVSWIAMPVGTLLYVGPMLVALVSPSLVPIFLSLLAVRVAGCALLFLACVRLVPQFPAVRASGAAARELFSFGGWMTVSNIASPVMVNMDRLFVGSLLSVSAVTYYVTPFEVVSKLLVIPSSIGGASFPEFSRLARQDAGGETRRYFLGTLRLVLVLLAPACAVLLVVAHPLLSLWVSPELADRSAGILRLLAIGVVINGASYVAFAFVQGMGRSDITARFHLLELLVYVPALYLLIARFGLPGVAMAWVFRVSLDAVLLFGYAASRLRVRLDPRVGQPSLEAEGR